jgi:cation transport ATPase
MTTIANADKKNIAKAFAWFTLSTIITWLFIIESPLYFSLQQQILSCSIAGAKWGIQILLALVFLQKNKWPFLERIGFTCLIGSVILLPYYISSVADLNNSATFFFGSLIVAVLVMIAQYYKSVAQLAIGLKWWFFWLGCLAIAITLQLTVVFHVIGN